MRFQNKCIGTVAYLGGLPAVLEEFAWSFAQLVQFNAESLCGPGEYIHYERAKLSLHSAARNSLVESMRGDWLLMLDTDHSFAPDLCARMLDRMNAANIDVLTGFYQYKAHPHPPVLYLENGEFFSPLGSWRPRGDTSGANTLDLFPVAAAGGGCLMVRRSVFDRIADEFHCGPFDILPPFGEDMSFFKRLKKLNIQTYCDARIACHHLMVKPVTLSDYDRDAVEVGPEIPVDAFSLSPARGV